MDASVRDARHEMNSIQPEKSVRNLQSKANSLDMPFHMFAQDWVMNEQRSLSAGIDHELTIAERNEIIQTISLNLYWDPIILMNAGYDDEGLQSFIIVRGSKVVQAIIGFLNDDNSNTPELIVYSELEQTDTDWIDSRKLRVIIYENLTQDEKSALTSYSDMWIKTNEELLKEGKKLVIL